MDTLKNLMVVKLTTAIALMVLFFASCAQTDDVESLDESSLQINVTAQGFSSLTFVDGDGSDMETRASESGYTTNFINEDKIGIIVISSDNVILQDNVPCTYNGTAWIPDGGVKIFPVSDATYLAYYPYSAGMNGKKTAVEIFSAFTPKTNQSAYSDYTASDLMTGVGIINGTSLNISLVHAFALVMVVLPVGAANATVKAGNVAIAPYQNGNISRYITIPQTGVTFSGNYRLSNVLHKWKQGNITLTAGKYEKIEVK